MLYQYVAYSTEGETVKGRLEASSESGAEELLWKLDYTIISLGQAREQGSLFGFGNRIKTRDLIVFSRQLATLIESGISIVRAIQLLQEQTSNKKLRQVLAEVVSDVRQGQFLSEAIAKHGKSFPTLYPRLIEVGERTGNLELVLRQLAVYLEKEEALVRKIRSAMSYPSFVLVLAVGVIFLMLTVALPPLMGLFESFDAELPLPTRILLALTDFFSTNVTYIVAAMVLGGGGLFMWLRTETGHWMLDRFMLKVPLIKRIIIQGAVARMCRSTATLLQAGLALPEIMQMVIRTQSNRVIKAALEQVRSDLLQGHGLSDPLANQDIFPAMLPQMVSVGEETGSLDTNMATLADFYEEEVDRAVAALSGALEPAMTIFIGGLVGFIAISVITPMYSLMGSIN